MELDFRDGPRFVPEYLASMMSGIETHRYTYEQAVQLANDRAMGDLMGRKQQDMIDKHFKEHKF
jgi:hypothetical protein